jgi:putative transcriptional regulator
MSSDLDYFSIDKQPFPKKGDIILSEPFIHDTHFTRAVILLCEITDNGVFGVVLNKPVAVDLDEIIDSDIGKNAKQGFSISLGGPVDDNHLYYIHSDSTIPNCERISGDYYFGGDFEVLKSKINSNTLNNSNVFFFVGYAGWDFQQLKEEIEDSCWLVVSKPDITESLLSNKTELWKNLVAKFGGKYKSMSEYPINPSNN